MRQITGSSVRVLLNTEATPALIAAERPDAVIAALGAVPFLPPIPGLDDPRVRLATAVYGREAETGNRVVVIGGGQVGCETALYLAKQGRQVLVVEQRSAPAPDASPTHRAELLQEMEKAPSLRMAVNCTCTGVSPEGVCYIGEGGGQQTAAADSIVIAAGMKSRTAQTDAFIGTVPVLIPVGDCNCPRTVEHAVKEAFYAAAKL